MRNKGETPKTMKALVAYDKDRYVFEHEYPAPECGSDDIIIKTEACGFKMQPWCSNVLGR